MKKILFALLLTIAAIIPAFSANSASEGPRETAIQFGYYVAHGDAVKASLTISPSANIAYYVANTKADIDRNGGLAEIIVSNEEIISAQEAKITIVFLCKKEGAKIEKTYTLLLVDDTWLIAHKEL